MFAQIVSRLEIIKTTGRSLDQLASLCCPPANNAITELYLDFLHDDFRPELRSFLASYSGGNLKVLEVRNMDEPLEIELVSEECPNLESLKMMLCGVWTNSHKTSSHLPRLDRMHIKTASPDTLLSFVRYNVSVTHMKISCPSEGKSKFADAFIQSMCSFKGLLPRLRVLLFCSKFPFGFTSAQRLIASLMSLQYIGPIDMFTKISKADITDLVGWVRERNWDVVIGYKELEYNVFSIDQSDPWRHKFIPDKGLIPVKKGKRMLSVPSSSGLSDDDISGDGRKRSRNNSGLFQPSQCSARKSGSFISMKKSNGSAGTSGNYDNNNNEDFEFEFAMDSDGFIKNKDYRWNHQVQTVDNDDDYDDYDEFDEDTMDVEELPDDAEFEWCWGEDGNLKIYEIDKAQKSDTNAEPFLDNNNENSFNFANNNARMKEPELKPSPLIESLIAVNSENNSQLNQEFPQQTSCQLKAELSESAPSKRIHEEPLPHSSSSKSKSLPNSKSCKTSNATSTSSRRAMKRNAAPTPPPPESRTTLDAPGGRSNNNRNGGIQTTTMAASAVSPSKAAKQDGGGDQTKMGKIASMFENPDHSIKKLAKLHNNNNNNNNKVLSNHMEDEKPKLNTGPVNCQPKTMVVEVFEYDPMLGYCTVKRKTVPIDEEESARKDSLTPSINLSYLQSPEVEEGPPLPGEAAGNPLNEALGPPSAEAVNPPREESKEKEEVEKKSESRMDKAEDDSCSELTSTTGQQQQQQEDNNAKRPSMVEGLVPLSSMSKYDIPFLGPLLANMGKGIPEPPRSKPPSLPKSAVVVSNVLPRLRPSKSLSEEDFKQQQQQQPPTDSEKSSAASDNGSKRKPTPDAITKPTSPRTDIKVQIEDEEAEPKVVNITVPKPEAGGGLNDADKKPLEEAKEWYWDYDDCCWKECEPDEEYEWEYLDSDDDDQKEADKAAEEAGQHQSITLPIRSAGALRSGSSLDQELAVGGHKMVVDRPLGASALSSDAEPMILQRDASKMIIKIMIKIIIMIK